MRHEELEPIDGDEALAILAGRRPGEPALALLRLALHEPDFGVALGACLRSLDADDRALRRAAVLGLGHLGRLHRRMPDDATGLVRRALTDPDPYVAGAARDALDDIATFVPR